MFLMDVFEPTQPKEVLAILNQSERSIEKRAKLVERLVREKGGLLRRPMTSLPKADLSRLLRARIDAWLETGIDTDGSESPRSRYLSATEEVYRAFRHTVAGAEVALRPGSSELMVLMLRPIWKRHGWNDYSGIQAREADRIFATVMTSDWKDSLCKCRHEPCGKYFIHPKPRRLYKHGTFCSRQHQASSSALVRTRNLRFESHCKLVEFAARELVKIQISNSDWQGNNNLKLQLAAALSKSMSQHPILRVNRQDVKVNWVTRHRLEIERKRREICREARSSR